MRYRSPALLLLLAACGAEPGAPRERVVIPPGSTVRTVADSLSAHGVISSRPWFKLVARLGGYERRIQSGPYEFSRGQGARATLRAMVSGRAILSRLTIPEGFTILDMADAIERNLGIPRAQFLAAARDSALLRRFEIPAPSFEGFLRPETYFFAHGVMAETVLVELAKTFQDDWDPAWDQSAEAQGLDRLAVVTLASLVEGEAQVDEDRPLVAAVYRTRLRIGMPLQADPTVQYAIQMATGARKPRLFDRDYQLPSPYNTYLRSGLPPGPVGAPSLKSIQAVLAPAQVPYLYFVAGPGGKHVFSRTYGEHLRAIRRIRGQT